MLIIQVDSNRDKVPSSSSSDSQPIDSLHSNRRLNRKIKFETCPTHQEARQLTPNIDLEHTHD